MTRKRDREQVLLDKAMAAEFVELNRKYVGKWLYAEATNPGVWYTAKFYIKPTKFTVDTYMGKSRVFLTGIILFRYPPRKDRENGWQLHGTNSSPGGICVFGDGSAGLVMRPATAKEIKRHMTIIVNGENFAHMLWNIKSI